MNSFVEYNNPTERRAAFMRSVNLRKEWEAKMQKRMKEMGIIKDA